LLWEVNCATDLEVYKTKRVKLKVACEAADTWIENSKDQEQQWALSRDGGHRLCMMTTKCLRELQQCVKRSSSFANTTANYKNIFPA